MGGITVSLWKHPRPWQASALADPNTMCRNPFKYRAELKAPSTRIVLSWQRFTDCSPPASKCHVARSRLLTPAWVRTNHWSIPLAHCHSTSRDKAILVSKYLPEMIGQILKIRQNNSNNETLLGSNIKYLHQ